MFVTYLEEKVIAILKIILVHNLQNLLLPKFAGQSVTFLFHIRDFQHSYLDPESGLSWMRYSAIYLSPSLQIPERHLKLCH
jgi:hypothetical protein